MAERQAEITFREYGQMVARQWRIVLFAVILAPLVAIAFSLIQTPQYVASSKVLIEPRSEDTLFSTSDSIDRRGVLTEIEVIEGRAVRARVREDLGLNDEPWAADDDEIPPEAQASAVGETDVVEIYVTDPNPDNAAVYADAYAQAYIDIRREQSVEEILAAAAEVQQAVDALQPEIDALPSRDPRRIALVGRQSSFEATFDQLLVDAALWTGGATIIENAELPEAPSAPLYSQAVVIALVLGLVIGVVGALAADYFDDKVRTPHDLERLTDLPVLARIPSERAGPVPVAMMDSTDVSTEMFRGLRTNLEYLALDRPLGVIHFTSVVEGDGTTSSAANLAVVMAHAGHRVAIVDADLRRPRLHEAFDVPAAPGVSELLLGTSDDAVRPVALGHDAELAVITAGVVPANPNELLSSKRARMLFAELAGQYDYVIVDAPPVLPVWDSLALAGSSDGILLLVAAGETSESDVDDALERLRRVAAPVLGVLLYGVDAGLSSNGSRTAEAAGSREPAEPVSIPADA